MTNYEYLVKHKLLSAFMEDYSKTGSGEMDERDFINRYGVIVVNNDFPTSVSTWLNETKHALLYVRLDEVFTTLLTQFVAGTIDQVALQKISEAMRDLDRKVVDDEEA